MADLCEVETSELLREKGAGSFEGKPLGSCEVAAKEAGVPLRSFRPSGESGESWEDVRKRARTFVRKHVLPFSKEEVMVRWCVVTHGGFIRELLSELFPNKSFRNATGNTGVSVVKVIQGLRGTEVSLERQNDTSHLEA